MKLHRSGLILGVCAALLAACSKGMTPAAPSGWNAVARIPAQRVFVVPGSVHAKAIRPFVLPRQGTRHVFPPQTFESMHRPNVTPPPQQNMTYHGGPVQHVPTVYLVFYGFSFTGPPWTDAVNDPDGVAAYVENFFTDLDCTTWMNTTTQYSDTTGYITNPCTSMLAGTYVDHSPPPTNPFHEADLYNEVYRLQNHYGIAYNVNTNWVVVTPHGMQENDNTNFGKFCAYHSYYYISTTPTQPFTLLPYVPDAGPACGASYLADGSGVLEGVSINAGHEEAETQTDPFIDGWYDTSYTAPYCDPSIYGANPTCEIADKCSWDGQLQNTTLGNGGIFATQPLWSNASTSCVQSYTAAPTFGPVHIHPKTVKFFAVGSSHDKSITVTQANYTGKFALGGGTCHGIAKIHATANAGGRGTFTITPDRFAQCSMKFVG
ncbi:MAG: hypothetical protein JO277_09270, partial [Candidatus Eremiobacteraeota bacterium]|nr:hypothetical protein [Candidatus Eremiobacteraeota bacterium]